MMVLFTIINPDAFLSVFNFRSIIVNASIFIILGVGVTFVIVTARIDLLSIGSVLVFASVMSAMVMVESLGTEGWAIAAVGAVEGAALAGALWGHQRLPSRQSECSRLHLTLGTMGMALGISQVITGGIDLYNVPCRRFSSTPSASGDIVWQIPTRGDRTRDRRSGRHSAAQDQVRALPYALSLQHGGVSAYWYTGR